MNTQSVAIVSGTEAGPAEAMVKVAASAEETEDGSLAVKTGNAEDSAAVTEIAETMAAPVSVRTEDAAEMKTVRMEENGAAVTKRRLTANTLGTERREKRKRERNGKSRASVTASPRENDLNLMRKLVDLPQKPQLCFCGKSCIVREECIGNNRKVCGMKTLKKQIPYILLGATLLLLLGLNIISQDHWLDSDMAAEMIFSHDKLVLFHGIPRVVYTADHGTAVSHLQQLACDPHDHEPGILWIDAGFLLLFYEAVKSIPRTYSVKLLSAAVAFFRDYDDAYADG